MRHLWLVVLMIGFPCGVEASPRADTIAVVPADVPLPVMPAGLFGVRPRPVVSRIYIQAGDVIPPWSDEARTTNPAERIAYHAANWIHISTRPGVVRRELLFAVGDSLDSLKVAETERTLRAYQFINESEIAVTPVSPGSVAVHVRTSDNFSLAPSFVLEGGGGSREVGVLLREHNFLGLGKHLGFQYTNKTEETIWVLEYTDPRLLGSRWRLANYLRHTSRGNTVTVDLLRPYFSIFTRGSAGGRVSWYEGNYWVYRSGVAVADFPHRANSANIWLSTRLNGDPHRRYRLRAQLDIFSEKFEDPPPEYGISMTDRGWAKSTITLSREIILGYSKMRNLDDYGIVEDVRRGWTAGIRGGVGHPWKPTDKTYAFSGLTGQWSGVLGPSATVISTSADMEFWSDGGEGRRVYSNFKTSAFLHTYFQGLPYQTIALNVNWKGGWDVDPPYDIYLGGRTGLRGYNAYQFAGTRRLLVNLEDRIYTPVKIAVLGIGLVAFADAGYAWPRGRNVSLRDLHTDVGFGIRVFNTRGSATRVSRMDFAWRLRGQRGFVVSFGGEQTFTLFNSRPSPSR
jgi:hypothetical protein